MFCLMKRDGWDGWMDEMDDDGDDHDDHDEKDHVKLWHIFIMYDDMDVYAIQSGLYVKS